MKPLFLVLFVLALSFSASAQQQTIEGTWLGGLDVNGMTLHLAFHVASSPTGFTATLDSLDQGAKGIPISSATQQGSDVAFDLPKLAASFKGKLGADFATITGTWSQGGGSLPLVLKRVAADAVLEQRRPQNPAKPYPYREEDVAYDNKSAAGVTLAGTLTLPSGKGPFPAAILIAGSGPHNRDEELLGHKPFLVLADFLTRHGIAVLRADKRGIGKSTGLYSGATSADFATDVEAALAYLKLRPEIDPHHIGLIGHSEGGIIAPMVAARNPGVAYVVLLAGSGVSGYDLMPEQIRLGNIAAGATPAQADQAADFQRELLTLIRTEKDPAALQKQLHDKLIFAMKEEQIAPTIAFSLGPWFRYFLSYDPATDLRKLTCPVLALNGSLDTQVSPTQNLPKIHAALQQAGNKHFETLELPNLNHLFQTAKTGSVSEYAQIEETISPTALNKIAAWITANN